MSDAAEAHAALIRRFYGALAARDAATMASCYTDDATFSDPVFPVLDAAAVRAMWAMLCARGKDLKVALRDVVADAESGAAHWTACYTFAATRRYVVNEIDATYAFRDGRIVRHLDRFDLWRWSRQALGLPGLLLGWTPMSASAIRKKAAETLAQWRLGTTPA